MTLRSALTKAWHSPTLTTWASLGTGAAKFLLVLPLVLHQFAAEEVAVWYLMATLMQVHFLLDFGFGVTASRYFAYAMGGARDLQRPHEGGGAPNHALMGRLYATMRALYLPLGLGAGALLGAVGTAMLLRPVDLSPSPGEAWLAWGIVLAGSVVGLCGLTYSTYLQGTNRVALLRRWESMTNVGAIATSVVVLLADGGLVALALATQTWTIVTVLRNRWLARATEPETFQQTDGQLDRAILRDVWRSAWRSGLGVLFDTGVVRLSAGFLALFVSPATLAGYLVALNILDRVNEFSMVPFYARVPGLTTLYSQGRLQVLARQARRAILTTLLLFGATGVLTAAIFDLLLRLTDSPVDFVGYPFWVLTLAALVVQRYAAMHLQLYTLSNVVVWHIANGVSGAIFAIVWMLAVPPLGVLGVPVALLASVCGFYAPYALRRSLRWQREIGIRSRNESPIAQT